MERVDWAKEFFRADRSCARFDGNDDRE
jgi:hypothetical protein